MTENCYAVIYGGQLAKGYDRKTATQAFAKLYRISEQRADELLSRKRLVLKHGLPENLAKRYQQAFSQAGVITQIRVQKDTAASSRNPAAAPEPAPSSSTTLMPNVSGTTVMPALDDPHSAATTVQAVVDVDDSAPQPVFDKPRPTATETARTQPSAAATAIMPTLASTRPDDAASSNAADPASANSAGGAIPPATDAEPTRESTIGAPVSLGFSFHGQTGAYFRIWIVNLTLSILTLGIYSAWAKVRNLRYFYGNTEVADGRFEFHGKPLSILLGRLIAIAVFAGYSLATNFLGLLAIPLVVILLLAMPWIINRSLAFRYRNTSFRGLRFGFSGDYFSALKAFVLWPIAAALTLGVLLPYALVVQRRYIVAHASYGRSRFHIDLAAKPYYVVALIAGLILIIGGTLIGALSMLLPLLPVVLILPLYAVFFAYFQANTTNLVFNASGIDQHGFESSLATRPLAVLYLTNALALILTLGLALPWVRIRMARYRAECLSLIALGSLDDYVADQQQQVSAAGEEIGDVFDLDLGL